MGGGVRDSAAAADRSPRLGYLSPLATAELAPFSVSRAWCGLRGTTQRPEQPSSLCQSSRAQGNPNPQPGSSNVHACSTPHNIF